MDVFDLQTVLAQEGLYTGEIDGDYGPKSRAGLEAALKGDLTHIDQNALSSAALNLNTTWQHLAAVTVVESAGRGFDPATRLPLILFEPHVFSSLTRHAFDASDPEVSYPHQGQHPYPDTQEGRWYQLHGAIALDPGAALESASWGLFQIMGENYGACGFQTPWEFCRGVAQSEAAQLLAFADFIVSRQLDRPLRDGRWADFARGYNGPSYASHHYDQKLAAAYARLTG